MNTLDLLQAALMLGAPMVALSWFIFSRLFDSGEIDRRDDHKAITARLKKLKKSAAFEGQPDTINVFNKWMWFGSGFYGLAALWTFVIIEVLQFLQFVFNFPGFAVLFEDGLIGFVIEFLLNQLGNVIQAFLWFGYWPSDSVIIWVLTAFVGYWAGVEMARRKAELSFRQWLDEGSDERGENVNETGRD